MAKFIQRSIEKKRKFCERTLFPRIMILEQISVSVNEDPEYASFHPFFPLWLVCAGCLIKT
jgi:hypothetical protein